MASTKTKSAPAPNEFRLVQWTESTGEAELRSAFRNKSAWVVSAPAGAASWYSTVLNNLGCRYAIREPASIDAVREVLTRGLTRAAFNRLKAVLDVSSEQLSEVIRVPPRTIARREVFKPDESERILRVAAAFQRAIEVIGDIPQARRWFSTPKQALGGKTPFEFCDTEPGAEEVVNLLGRIEHGVFS